MLRMNIKMNMVVIMILMLLFLLNIPNVFATIAMTYSLEMLLTTSAVGENLWKNSLIIFKIICRPLYLI